MSIKISVVMAVYNAQAFLQEAIDSILCQSFEDFEFIIVNDGSTDESFKIIQKYAAQDYRIQFINQINMGLSFSLNNGLKLAKGKYIVRMDADDISLSHRLYTQYEFIESNPDFVLVGSNANVIDCKGNFIYKTSQKLSNSDIKAVLPSNPFIHPSVIIRRDAVLACGGYNEELIHHVEDQVLWNTLANYGKFANIKDSLIQYRKVPSSISNRTAKLSKRLNQIVNEGILTNNFDTNTIEEIILLSKKMTTKDKLSNYYQFIGKKYTENNFNRKKASINYIKSLYYKPLNYITIFNLILLIFPVFVIKIWKRYRMNYSANN